MLNNVLTLLWKNLLIRKYHVIATLVEVIIPICVVLLFNKYLPKVEKDIYKGEVYYLDYKAGECNIGHSYEDIIMYEPNTSFTNNLMQLAACYAGYNFIGVKAGNLSEVHNNTYYIGVKFFGNVETQPTALIYTLYPTSPGWSLMNVLWSYKSQAVPDYGFPFVRDVTELQRAIDASFLSMGNTTLLAVDAENTDYFDRNIRLFTFVVILAFYFAITLMIPNIIARIVDEKYSGAKELMLMMGVKRIELWITKFIDAYIFAFLSITGIIIFLYVPLTKDSNVLQVSSLILWSVCMYGLIGLILYFFFLSCLFIKASLAVFIAEIIAAFLLILHNFVESVVTFPVVIKFFFSFFPQVTLINGVRVLMDFDYYGKEVKLREKLSEREDYSSLLEVLIFMTLNIFLYIFLIWYTEQVIPGRYGLSKPYFFFFKKEYWVPKKVHTVEPDVNLNELNQENFEFVPPDLKPGVTIQNVSKIYPIKNKDSVVAVDNVTINFYVSEITALLGHNGAGKTTVFSLITGLTFPNSGKIFINGYDLSENVKQARRDLGMCPQQDMLFHELSSKENMLFFGMIKGLRYRDASAEAEQLIDSLNLKSVKKTKSGKLSGGQKRKVSLAIALIGGSKILVLDEPSSGLDPEIRREIWEILLNLRGDRTILLTTHFMEEAEALSDRIAIMDKGKIKCFGSSLYLKSKYGQGYILSVVLKEAEKLKKMTNFIKEFAPGAKFKSQNIKTVKYEIPLNEIRNFPKLLEDLDKYRKNNEIGSYSISLSTLEDVFLRLRIKNKEQEMLDVANVPSYKKLDDQTFDGPAEKKLSFCALLAHQFWALLLKKYIYFYRTIYIFLVYCVLSIVLILFLGLLENKIKSILEVPPDMDEDKSILYSPSLYSPFIVLYSGEDQNITNNFREFINKQNCEFVKVENVRTEIEKIFHADFYTYSRKINLGYDFTPDKINIFYNRDAVHIFPIGLNLLHNFLSKYNNNSYTIATSLDTKYVTETTKPLFVEIHNCHLPELSQYSSLQILYYLLGPIREYTSGVKHIQLMATYAFLYWFSNLLFDIVTFAMYMVPVIIYFHLIDETNYMNHFAGQIYLALFFWGLGLLVLTYVVIKITKHEAGGLVLMIILYVFFTFIVTHPFIGANLPSFFSYLHPNSIIQIFFDNICEGKCLTKYLLYLLIYAVTLFFILLFLEWNWWKKILHRLFSRCAVVNYHRQTIEEDRLVQKEKGEVESILAKNETMNYPLVVHNLKRSFLVKCKAKPIVRGISFHVRKGECFGLLGVNGAGKTTTFKMLSTAIPPSSGKICIETKVVRVGRLQFKKKNLFNVSYCPQNNGLISKFTGKEMLMFIGRLRGLHGKRLRDEVANLLENLDLKDLADKNCGTYSGGNKRKLAAALAVIADTHLIFLDEPTTGVDPVSRRLMWNLINHFQKKGRSFILTSHSMDECEALCTRLAIMVDGRFRCIGELATLKEKFGEGYFVQLKISVGASDEKIESIKAVMFENFEPGIVVLDDHKTYVQYKITNPNVTWAELFNKLNNLKSTYDEVESYGASSTTLEQIFISFARNNHK